MRSKQLALYASVGPMLTHYEVNVEGLALRKRAAVTLPSNVQYAWPHSSLPVLYVACSSRVDPTNVGNAHFLCALKINDATGALSMHGEPVRLSHRPINMTTDNPSRHALLATNIPPGLVVIRIEQDGTLGVPVAQRTDLDFGIFPHQVRVAPDNRSVVLVTRGNRAKTGSEYLDPGVKQIEPGALKVFGYRDGVLGEEASVAPGDGYHFGPRHLDFDPSARWVYVSLEPQNMLYVHKREDGRILSNPAFVKDILADRAHTTLLQRAGTIHVHPNGRVVYCVNRGDKTRPLAGKDVVIKPDNTFAVFSINPQIGEPNLIQHIDTAGISARTFSIDPSGRMLVAANSATYWVKQTDDADVRLVPANLAVFRVQDDGRLQFVRKYDFELGMQDEQSWMGIVAY